MTAVRGRAGGEISEDCRHHLQPAAMQPRKTGGAVVRLVRRRAPQWSGRRPCRRGTLTGGWCEPTPGLLDGVERLEPCGEPVSSRGSGSGRAERPDASPVMRPGVIPEPLGPARRLLSQPERPPAPWPSGREGAGASSRPGRLPGRSDAIVRSAVGPPVPMSPCYGVAARELYTARAVPRSLESAGLRGGKRTKGRFYLPLAGQGATARRGNTVGGGEGAATGTQDV